MPYKPKHPCSYPGCPGWYRAGIARNIRRSLRRITISTSAIRPASAGIGGHGGRSGDRYLAGHPLCEKCREAGRLTNAEEVHHIKPLSKGGTHAEHNLMALCKRCHSEITAREGGRWG